MLEAKQSATQAGAERIDGWKNIAAYLDRSVRTIQRWESTHALPIRRISADNPKSSVFAYKADLDAWWRLKQACVQDAPEKTVELPPTESVNIPAEPAPAPVKVRALDTIAQRPMVVALAALGVLIIAGIASFRTAHLNRPPIEKVTRLVGQLSYPSVAPDGHQVVFEYTRDGRPRQLYVADLATDRVRQVSSGPGNYYYPKWSPDGKTIAFVRMAASTADLLLLDVQSGTAQFLYNLGAFSWASTLSWSPDGQFLFAVQRPDPQSPFRIVRISVRDAHSEFVTDPPATSFGDFRPLVTRDGKSLLVQRYHGQAEEDTDIWLQPLDDAGKANGPARQITFEHAKISGFDVTPSGRDLAIRIANTPDAGLWVAHDFLSGINFRRHATLIGNTGFNPAFMPGGDLLYVDGNHTFHHMYLWSGENQFRQICSSSDDDWQPDWAPDARHIAYLSRDRSGLQIMTCDVESGAAEVLTHLSDTDLRYPHWSPDGSRIAYARAEGKEWALWVTGTGGHNGQQQATRLGPMGAKPGKLVWASDGKSLFVTHSGLQGPGVIWRVPVDGSAAQPLTGNGYDDPLIDPADGQLYAVETASGQLVRVLPDGRLQSVLAASVPGREAFAPHELLALQLAHEPVWHMQLVRSPLSTNSKPSGRFEEIGRTPDGTWDAEPQSLAVSRDGRRRIVVLLDKVQWDLYRVSR